VRGFNFFEAGCGWCTWLVKGIVVGQGIVVSPHLTLEGTVATVAAGCLRAVKKDAVKFKTVE
jgi:hypothetical protein